MAKGMFKMSGGLAALAASLAALALPASAIAQEGRPSWRGGEGRSAQSGSSDNGRQAPLWRSRGGDGNSAARPEARQQAPANTGRLQRGGDGARPNQPAWRGNQPGVARPGGEARDRSTVRNWQGPAFRNPNNGTAQPDRAQSNRSWQDRRAENRPAWEGRRPDDRRGDQWRDRDRDRDGRNDGRWDRNDRRDRGDRWDRGDNRRWNNAWRNDRRYDWQHYRSSNRNVYRLGRYYAPYRNYYYRPLSSGFRLDALFFGSNYWINDPWQYRLPPAYGGYRWIRYFDDVLLVDTYSGEVVDVIRDFFW